jgi:hypothetical protein
MTTEAKAASDAKRGWYRQIGVSRDTFAKLSALKDKKAQALGIDPSWNEFFQLLMPGIEKAASSK